MVNADNFDPDMDFEILANKPIKQYQIYKEKLIKTKGTPDKNSWDIFIDELLLFYPDQSVRWIYLWVMSSIKKYNHHVKIEDNICPYLKP